MKVQEVMHTGLETIDGSATLQQSAQMMKELDIGLLAVFKDNRISGLVTDRDLATRAVAAGMDAKTTKVQDVMSSEPTAVLEDQDVEQAAAIMKTRKVRRLLVCNHDKQVTGVLSLGDLATHHQHQGEHFAEDVLEQVCEPVQQ